MRVPFKLWQDLAFPAGEMLSIDWIFPQVFLGFPYEAMCTLPAERRDVVVIVGKDRAEALKEIERHPGRVVAAFTPRDAGLRVEQLGGRPGLPDNVVAAFATNNELADERAVSIPLGVRTKNLEALQRVLKARRAPRQALLYANFATAEFRYPPTAESSRMCVSGSPASCETRSG